MTATLCRQGTDLWVRFPDGRSTLLASTPEGCIELIRRDSAGRLSIDLVSEEEYGRLQGVDLGEEQPNHAHGVDIDCLPSHGHLDGIRVACHDAVDQLLDFVFKAHAGLLRRRRRT